MKRLYVLLLGASSLLSLLAFLLVIYRMSPFSDTSWLSLSLLIISLAIFLTSFVGLIGTIIRILVYKHATYFFHFVISIRQGVLIALFAVGYLIFSILDVVTWWNLVLLFSATMLIELYFINRD